MKRILLALDGGESADRALETAASLARAFAAELAVVSVVPAPSDDAPENLRRGRDLLAARARLADLGIDAEVLEPAGDPACRIEQIADEGGYDTIVLGARRAAGISGALAGTVSNHVLTHASGVVVVTR